MDPITTTIAGKLGGIVLGKGLELVVNLLYNKEDKLDKIQEGVNVLLTTEFQSAASWLRQAPFRADTKECMRLAEIDGKKAIYNLPDIKLKVQAYSICILAGYYNSSDGGRELLKGKATATDYLDELKSTINEHFKGLSTEEIKKIAHEKAKDKTSNRFGYAVAALAIASPLIMTAIGVHYASQGKFPTKSDLNTLGNGGLLAGVGGLIASYIQALGTDVTYIDRLFCDKAVYELETSINNLPEGQLPGSKLPE